MGPPQHGGHGYPGPPPKKSKAGRVVAIILCSLFGLLLLGGGGGYVVLSYLEYTELAGSPPSDFALPAACDKVGAGTLAQLHTTNADSSIATDAPGWACTTAPGSPPKG
jgi:hypothetical protein